MASGGGRTMGQGTLPEASVERNQDEVGAPQQPPPYSLERSHYAPSASQTPPSFTDAHVVRPLSLASRHRACLPGLPPGSPRTSRAHQLPHH